MPEGIPFLDILIFAIIAIFLGLRLRSVLGKRIGYEQDFTRDPEAVEKMKNPPSPEETKKALNDIPQGKGIDVLMAADPGFNQEEFIEGAKGAYQIVIEAFAEEDTDTLKSLLSYEMNSKFSEAIHERQKANEKLAIILKTVNRAVVEAIEVSDGVVGITVEFLSEQVRILRDEKGEIIDGVEDQAETFVDIWTFERDISSQDPNWLLVNTKTIES